MLQKPKTIKNKKYKEWISGLACCVSGYRHPDEPNDPHHVPAAGHGGMAIKADDTRCIPLRHDLHVEFHQIGSKSFAEKYRIDFEVLIEAYQNLYRRKH